ncbi:MAG: 50S ribosomal protein L18, partial [Beggiatoa sp.]|nr:50S ribosomal protein L18 [Beggiatoa sp.]
MDKKQSRLRRARRARAKIKELVVHRLCVYRTPRHIYAQLIAPNGA